MPTFESIAKRLSSGPPQPSTAGPLTLQESQEFDKMVIHRDQEYLKIIAQHEAKHEIVRQRYERLIAACYARIAKNEICRAKFTPKQNEYAMISRLIIKDYAEIKYCQNVTTLNAALPKPRVPIARWID